MLAWVRQVFKDVPQVANIKDLSQRYCDNNSFLYFCNFYFCGFNFYLFVLFKNIVGKMV